MKDESCIVSELCEDLGLNPATEFARLRRSIFSEYLEGDDARTARIKTEVVRMWLTSMVSPRDVRPEMREIFEQIRQVGAYELREAWEVSELPMDRFKNVLLSGGAENEAAPPTPLLH